MKDPIIRYVDEGSESMRPEPEPPPRLLSLSAAVRSLRPPTGKAQKRRWWSVVSVIGCAIVAAAYFGLSEEAEPWVVSGSPKLKVTESGELVRWRTGDVTLTLDPSLAELGPAARDSVLLGFDAWSAEHPHLPRLTFDVSSQRRRPERDGVNQVTYGKIEAPGYRHALAITMAYSLPSTGEIIEADLIINSRYRFGGEHHRSEHASKHVPEHAHDGCRETYDLQSLVAHEAGHFFGLGEDVSEAQATMYHKQSRCELHKRDLFETDVVAAQSVYAEPIDDEEAAQAGAACSLSRGSPAPAPWLAVVVGVAGVWWARRRR